MSGTRIVKDGTYHYSKEHGHREGEKEEEFSFYQEIKVDSRGNRASQKLWTDDTQQELVAHQAADFANSRVMTVDVDERGALHCTIFQFARTLADTHEVLDWVWTPRAENTITIFMGE